MSDDRIEICFRLESSLDSPDESVEPPETIELVSVAQLRNVERSSEEVERFVVGLQWDRKRMAVLASERE